MKNVLISGVAALILTSGFAFAESQLGVDQTIHAPVTSSLDFDSGVSSTFDAASNTDNQPLASVELDQNSQTLGVR